MVKIPKLTFFCLLSLFFVLAKALADDFNLPVAAPVMNMTTPLITRSIEVDIDEDNCLIAYSIINSSKNDLNYTIMLTAPRYSWKGMAENNPDRRYADLQVRSNGTNVGYHKKTEAFLHEKNVTEIFLKNGVDPNIISNETLLFSLKDKNRKGFSALVEKKLFTKDKLPTWSVKNTYSWFQSFPAGKEQRIEYAFAPLWGTMVVEGEPDKTYFLVEGFGWYLIEQYHEELSSNGKSAATDLGHYLVKWLSFPLANISGNTETEEIAIKVLTNKDSPNRTFVFLSYGDMIAKGFGKAEISYKNVTGTDMVGVVIVSPID